MTHLKHEKKITWFVVITFIAQPVLMFIAFLTYPPDFSKEFPVYNPDSIMVITYGNALFLAGLTVMGIKLADEKKVLPAAGFTMFAISAAILMTSLFEISQVISLETYEKFYRIQASTNFLYLPAMFLISAYEDFKKWTRYIGLISSIPLFVAGFMFLFGNRDFQTLESISNTGFFLMAVTSVSWAYNVYFNYRRNSK
ncbi:MAG TPA: hypothetical protein VF487_08430 [Chitinophagaceae bacterium]